MSTILTTSKTVYLSRLDTAVTEERLYLEIHKLGRVDQLKLPKDDKGKSLGYAYVTFQDNTQAENAKEKLNNYVLMDKEIKATLAIRKEEIQTLQQNKLFFQCKNTSVTSKQLESFFSTFGKVFDLELAKDKQNQSLGYGYVILVSKADTDKLIQQSQADNKSGYIEMPDKTQIQVERYKTYEDREHQQTCSVYVREFEKAVSEADSNNQDAINKRSEEWKNKFTDFGKKAGELVNVSVIYNKENKNFVAFIVFKEEDAAQKLVDSLPKEWNKQIVKSSKSSNANLYLKNLKGWETFLQEKYNINPATENKENPDAPKNEQYTGELADENKKKEYKVDLENQLRNLYKVIDPNVIVNVQEPSEKPPQGKQSTYFATLRFTDQDLSDKALKMSGKSDLTRDSNEAKEKFEENKALNQTIRNGLNKICSKDGYKINVLLPKFLKFKLRQVTTKTKQQQDKKNTQLQNPSSGIQGMGGIPQMFAPQQVPLPMMGGGFPQQRAGAFQNKQPYQKYNQQGGQMPRGAMGGAYNKGPGLQGGPGGMNNAPMQQFGGRPNQSMPQNRGGAQGYQNRSMPKQGGQFNQQGGQPFNQYGQNQNLLGQQQQKPAQQQNGGATLGNTITSAPVYTLDQIKKDLQNFISKSQEEQRLILGQLIYPQVNNLCNTKANAPKITGMLIDLSVFEISDILEFLEDENELKERVEEAEQLINQSQPTQQPPK